MAGKSPLGFPEDQGLLHQLSNAINNQATHPGGGEQNNRTYFMENMWLGHFSARTACLGSPHPQRVGHPRWKLESPEGLFLGRSGGGHQLLAGTCPGAASLSSSPGPPGQPQAFLMVWWLVPGRVPRRQDWMEFGSHSRP